MFNLDYNLFKTRKISKNNFLTKRETSVFCQNVLLSILHETACTGCLTSNTLFEQILSERNNSIQKIFYLKFSRKVEYLTNSLPNIPGGINTYKKFHQNVKFRPTSTLVYKLC